MEDMLKIAGKGIDGTAKGFLLENDGRLIISRHWDVEVNTILNGIELRDADPHVIDKSAVIEIGKYPINSLRIRSTLDTNIVMTFYIKKKKNGTTYIDNLGDTYTIYIEPGNTHWQLVSPDELKLLEYGKYLKFKYQASEAPTTGKLWITHAGKL